MTRPINEPQQGSESPRRCTSVTQPSIEIPGRTPERHALFDDTAVTAGWIEVIAVLAETEAENSRLRKK